MVYLSQYVLKLSISIGVIYLFYVLVLRRLTFYNWNRWYLLGYTIMAFFIPFINISPFLQQNEWEQNGFVQIIPVLDYYAGPQSLQSETIQQPLTAVKLLWWLFAAGAGILLLRLLVQYQSYRRLKKSATMVVDEAVKVYQVEDNITPFSFGNAIFINRELHSEKELEEIMRHEFIHVKQKHTADILWTEFFCIINWYNPFAWLIRKAIRQNLEFIADRHVLQSGINKKQYQYLLLKVMGNPGLRFVQSFSFNSLRNRITMMNKIKSARIQLTLFLFLVPLVAVLLLAFRNSGLERLEENVSEPMAKAAEAVTSVPVKTDTVPPVYHPLRWKEAFLKKHPGLLNVGWVIGDTSGRPSELILFFKDKTTKEYDLKNEGELRAFESKYGQVPGYASIKVSRIDSSIVVMPDEPFVIDASLDRNYAVNSTRIRIRGVHDDSTLNNVLYIIDGVPQPKGVNINKAVGVNNIEIINVLKNESAVNIYGEAGKNGVIVIKTKSGTNENRDINKLDSVNLQLQPHQLTLKSFRGIFIVDGVEYENTTFEALNLDNNKIESINVLKGQKATAIYGEKAADGVIIINTKKTTRSGTNNTTISVKVRGEAGNPVNKPPGL